MDKEYKHDNYTIMREVDIPYNFLKRCNAELPILERFRQKKDKNKIYYNDNGLIVWREIRSLFEQGKTMSQINTHLESTLENKESTLENTKQTTGINLENEISESGGGRGITQFDHIRMFIDALEKQAASAAHAWQKAYERSEKDAEQAHRKVIELETKLLALPDGKSPEQLATDLKEKKEQEYKIQQIQDRAAKRQELWIEHDSQTGWGRHKRKRDILKKIKEFDADN